MEDQSKIIGYCLVSQSYKYSPIHPFTEKETLVTVSEINSCEVPFIINEDLFYLSELANNEKWHFRYLYIDENDDYAESNIKVYKILAYHVDPSTNEDADSMPIMLYTLYPIYRNFDGVIKYRGYEMRPELDDRMNQVIRISRTLDNYAPGVNEAIEDSIKNATHYINRHIQYINYILAWSVQDMEQKIE